MPPPYWALPPVMTPPFTSVMCSPEASSAARVHRGWEVSNLWMVSGELSSSTSWAAVSIRMTLPLPSPRSTLPLRSRVTSVVMNRDPVRSMSAIRRTAPPPETAASSSCAVRTSVAGLAWAALSPARATVGSRLSSMHRARSELAIRLFILSYLLLFFGGAW